MKEAKWANEKWSMTKKERPTKVCNCVGGANCNDETCEIVKKYRESQKGGFRRIQ